MRGTSPSETMRGRRAQIATRRKLQSRRQQAEPTECLPDEADESDTDSTKVTKEPAKQRALSSDTTPRTRANTERLTHLPNPRSESRIGVFYTLQASLRPAHVGPARAAAGASSRRKPAAQAGSAGHGQGGRNGVAVVARGDRCRLRPLDRFGRDDEGGACRTAGYRHGRRDGGYGRAARECDDRSS
jgi:hypothetical protein